MKLISLKVYQPVQFNKKQYTFFSVKLAELADISIELDAQRWAVIKGKGEHILISPANVQADYLDNEENRKKDVTKENKSTPVKRII